MTDRKPKYDKELARAYAACRRIARREAKNFYYAFLALPPERRNAMCAIYAFMRRADDLADVESAPIEARRRRLATRLLSWRKAGSGAPTIDFIFLAVRDATKRFEIPIWLLDELVQGVTLDLGAKQDGAPQTYDAFPELYKYCYLVASVVGLVCIKIFGYSDLRAEKLAEETGIAFQLTNILRDVAEDAERNRVYLPLKDLEKYGVTPESLLHHSRRKPPTPAERELFASYARLAQHYYKATNMLFPLVDPISRPALWVLVSIYRALLKRIERANYDVFRRRIRVPLWRKLTILARGLIWMAWARIFG